MSLLKQLLMDKKFYEMEADVDKFIEKSGIEPGSMGQRLEFDSEVFSDADQVQDFLRAHLFETPSVEKKKGKFIATIIDSIGFIESTIEEVEIREGVTLVVGI